MSETPEDVYRAVEQLFNRVVDDIEAEFRDPDWARKIETARDARALGRRLRAGKPGSFRRGVGRNG